MPKSAAESKKPRLRKLTKSQQKAKDKKSAKNKKVLATSLKLTASAFHVMYKNWQVLGGIVLVYILLSIFFASGAANLNSTTADIGANIDTKTASSALSSSLKGYGELLGSGSGGASANSSLQPILVIIASLAIIWALRQLLAGNKISIKNSYYKSTSQLIPFVLILMLIVIQLLPLILGSAIVNAILQTAFIGSTFWQVVILGSFFVIFASWTFYMISSSIFAMYISTLPDVQPLKALRSAKDLVKFRRLILIRKLIFLPILIFIAIGIIVVPLILFARVLVAPVFYVLGMSSILFIHTYLYMLYRELINE
jgi:hypothetical protein